MHRSDLLFKVFLNKNKLYKNDDAEASQDRNKLRPNWGWDAKNKSKKKKRRKIFCFLKEKVLQNIPSRKHFSRKSNTKYEQTTLNYVTDLIKH